MTQYPQLGTVVTFLRVDEERKVQTGKGIVQALVYQPNDYVLAQVKVITKDVSGKETDKVYNVDIRTLNYNHEKIKVYQKLITETDKIGEDGNKLIDTFAKETTVEYNEKIKVLKDQALGSD